MIYQKRIPRALLALFPAVLGMGLLFCPSMTGSAAFAQDVLTKPAAATEQAGISGKQFVGPFGVEDERAPKQDTFTFKDGTFVTASCLEWGFSPAPYWLRRDAQGIHFLAELESAEHGTMRYQGSFDGDKLSVVAYWKKARWYWTTERTYRGFGRPAAAAQ
jgi:hypothetical protein